ncbi:hypothetical protein LCM10_18565 [Rossellomorea aquimaris]|uniref:hypothetical protein n=1 Tax=Rossellomorea aquimaris TaxID=189382 RepID=UPI001CD64854|nr:hypothetical protein [Rossellomorea aquimaris]MCA1056970.1 hypothetical protein [Rossellomorea aquimaris]
MLERRLLIVDDYVNTAEETIPEYEGIFEDLQENQNLNYKITFLWEPTIQSAIERLSRKDEVIDVVLIDYDFNTGDQNTKGITLVKQIRETINKRCKIIFYTMHGINQISRGELIELINNDVFRFLSKSGETLPLKYEKVGNESDQLIIEAVIDAISNSDPISNTLEKYLVKYSHILDDLQIDIDGSKYPLNDLIKAIRLYQEPGNRFVNNLLEMSILEYLES